jgi:uncharacterized protein (UPF0210 family)
VKKQPPREQEKTIRTVTISIDVACEPADAELRKQITNHIQQAAEHLVAAFRLTKKVP